MDNYSNYKDIELIELLHYGDEEAFSAIYNRYSIELISFAQTKLFEKEMARDIIHDVFVGIWEKRSNISINENLKAYLYTAVRYQVIRHIRKNIVRETYRDYLNDILPQFDTIEKAIDAKDLQKQLDNKLDTLPSKTKIIFELSRNQDKSINEIAEELNISPQTVKNQLTIALKHLRSAISTLLFTLF